MFNFLKEKRLEEQVDSDDSETSIVDIQEVMFNGSKHLACLTDKRKVVYFTDLPDPKYNKEI